LHGNRKAPRRPDNIEQAIKIYTTLGYKGSSFNADCVFSGIHILKDDFQQAHISLNKAFRCKTDSRDMGYYYELKSRVAMGTGFYTEALYFSEKSHATYLASGDFIRATNALCSVAFFQLLVGEIDEGIANTKKVDGTIYGSNEFSQISYYNLLNWLLIYRCSKEPYTQIESDLRAYIEKSNDSYLEKVFDFVKNWNCEE
jgi:hypothetical protein